MAGETAREVVDKAASVVATFVETHYSHKNVIHTATGVYDIDCNGFVGFVLKHAAPEHYAEVPVETGHVRPRAFKYYDYFVDLPEGSLWSRVPRLADALPGDVIAWRLADHPELGHNTGHVMIVAEPPGDDLTVRVYDSSDVLHFDDTRRQGGDSPVDGVGSGTLQFAVNPDGEPIACQFGPGDQSRPYPIAIGRLGPLTS